jgi:hypothetical protein
VTRFVNAPNASAVQQPNVPFVLFLELDFLSGTLYLSSADRYFTWGGNLYSPLGTFAGITDLTETTDITSQQLQFTLSGVDSGLLNTTLGEAYHGRNATLSVGYLDPVNWELVAAPETIWEGLMDVLTIKANANSSSITLSCENRLMLWNDASGWLYTQDHQRLIDSTDNFLDQVTSIATKTVVWGNSGVNTGPGYTPGPVNPITYPPVR